MLKKIAKMSAKNIRFEAAFREKCCLKNVAFSKNLILKKSSPKIFFIIIWGFPSLRSGRAIRGCIAPLRFALFRNGSAAATIPKPLA
ncbi:MAG: hypothetical protein SOT81_07270 [Treponema sp.]|nr:hypothetical protein [Treponema sp.]